MVRATCEQGQDGNGKHGAMASKHRPVFPEIGPRTVETFHLGSRQSGHWQRPVATTKTCEKKRDTDSDKVVYALQRMAIETW
jgi:hypothetical protein